MYDALDATPSVLAEFASMIGVERLQLRTPLAEDPVDPVDVPQHGLAGVSAVFQRRPNPGRGTLPD